MLPVCKSLILCDSGAWSKHNCQISNYPNYPKSHNIILLGLGLCRLRGFLHGFYRISVSAILGGIMTLSHCFVLMLISYCTTFEDPDDSVVCSEDEGGEDESDQSGTYKSSY